MLSDRQCVTVDRRGQFEDDGDPRLMWCCTSLKSDTWMARPFNAVKLVVFRSGRHDHGCEPHYVGVLEVGASTVLKIHAGDVYAARTKLVEATNRRIVALLDALVVEDER